MSRQTAGIAIVGIVAVLGMSFIATAQNDTRYTRNKRPEKLQSPMKPFMHGKLDDFQAIMTSLVQRDFKKLEASSRSLRSRYVNRPQVNSKQEFDDEVYEHFGLEFMRLSARLTDMAKEENLEGAAFHYQNLTATCIACHDHLRDKHPTKNKVRHVGTDRSNQ